MATNQQKPQKRAVQQQSTDGFDTRDYIPSLLLQLQFNSETLTAIANGTLRHQQLLVLNKAAYNVFQRQVTRFDLPSEMETTTNLIELVHELQTGTKRSSKPHGFYEFVYKILYTRLVVNKEPTPKDELVTLVKEALVFNNIKVPIAEVDLGTVNAAYAAQLRQLANELVVDNKVRATVIQLTRLITQNPVLLSDIPVKQAVKKPKPKKKTPAPVTEVQEEAIAPSDETPVETAA